MDFGFFFSFIELFGLWPTTSRRKRKGLVNYALPRFLLKNNGCNIMDGERIVVKLLLTNKRYFFQENSHYLLPMLLVFVHAWFISLFCLSTMATLFFPFSLYFVLPFTSLPFCFYFLFSYVTIFLSFLQLSILFSSND